MTIQDVLGGKNTKPGLPHTPISPQAPCDPIYTHTIIKIAVYELMPIKV